MKKLLVVYSILFLSFSSCMVEGVYDTSLLLDDISSFELSSKDTIFIVKEGTQSISYQVKYYNSQGLVSLGNAFQPKLLLNGNSVTPLEIDLSKEQVYSVIAELPNRKKLMSNELLIRVLSLENAISKINLIYLGTSNILIPELKEIDFDELFRIELELVNGEKMLINSQFLDFDFLINDIKNPEFELQNLNFTGEGKVQVQFKDLLSNPVELKLYKIIDAVSKIDFGFKKESNRMIKFEENGSFSDYFTAIATLINEQKINYSDYPELFSFFVNNNPLGNFKVQDLPEGRVSFISKVGDIISNPLEIEVINPFNFIKSIELSFSDSTNNPFAVAGKTQYDFNYKIVGVDNSEINLKAELRIQDVKQQGFENILISSSGQLKAEVVAYGKKSNALVINSRSDISYPKVRIPLIFHILPNYTQIETVSEQQLKNTINLLNQAYSNTYLTSQSNKKSSSAVNVGIEFYPAVNSIDGTPLVEKGIHRIPDNRSSINYPTTNGDVNFLFNQMWDPTQYLNVFVSKIEGPAGGFAYYPLVENFSLPGIGNVPLGTKLNYPYVSVIGYGMTDPTDVYVLAHEIGHMLGLYHSHRPSVASCPYELDYCPDTDGVILNRNIVGLIHENCNNQKTLDYDFMSYVSIKNSFTFDQRERVRRVLEHNPFLPVSGNKSRLVPFQKGKLDYSIKPVE
jgi:hypothetical protein